MLVIPLLALVVLQAAQLLLKHTAQDRMRYEMLQTIRVPAEKVVWEKKEKELLVDGRMFDVREYTVRDGILTATGFFDDAESGLLGFIAKRATGKEAGSALVGLLFFGQCFVALLGWSLPRLFLVPLQERNSFCNRRLSDPLLRLLVPPPRFCWS